MTLIAWLFCFPASNRNTPPDVHFLNKVSGIDVWYMAAVIESEARGEPCECQVLVGEVLQNRAKRQGKTIAESAFIGFKRKTPSEKSIEIARKVLTLKPNHGLFYFFNPDLSTDKKWLKKVSNRKKIRCGGHLFFGRMKAKSEKSK